MTERDIDWIYEYKKKEYAEHKLRALFFEVTSRCNARCEHCGSSCGDFVPKDEITAEEIKSVLDDVNEHYGASNIMLYITGGEPMVRKDLFEIMEYAHNLGFRWGMTSNGILIDEEAVKKMEKAYMETVSISIDGTKELHESFRRVPGAFDKICKGIKLMQKCPTISDLQITTCVNKKNLDQLDDILKIVKDLGVKDWRIIEVDPIGRAKGNTDLLLSPEETSRMFQYIIDTRKKNPDMKIKYGCGHFLGNELNIELLGTCYFCFTGYWVASVLSNGDVFGCPDIERRPELIQGNIRERNFSDIWENEFKNYRTIDRTSNETCKACPDWKVCLGDAFHTWDWDENKPNFCVREMFKEEYDKMDKAVKVFLEYRDKILKGKAEEKAKKETKAKKTAKKTTKKATKKATTKKTTKKVTKKTTKKSKK